MPREPLTIGITGLPRKDYISALGGRLIVRPAYLQILLILEKTAAEKQRSSHCEFFWIRIMMQLSCAAMTRKTFLNFRAAGRILLSVLFVVAVIAFTAHHSGISTDAHHSGTECAFCLAHQTCGASGLSAAVSPVTTSIFSDAAPAVFVLAKQVAQNVFSVFQSRAPPLPSH